MKMKKLVSVLMSVLMTAAVLSACSSGSNTGGTVASSQTPSSSDGFAKGKFDPPIDINTIACTNSTYVFKNGENMANNVHTKWTKDHLGIQMKYKWVTAEDQCPTKLRLALSSGEPLPDVFVVHDATLASDLIESGRVMDVSEAFDKYASDKVKQIFGQDPSYWYGVSKDGGKYGIPILEKALQNDPVMWIREDWLKQLNLKAPTTFDELTAVMDAFMKANLGKQDKPVGMALSLKNGYTTWMSDASFIFGGFGVEPGYWNKWNGDTIGYGSIQPQTKDALTLMSDWFKKGYISPDAGLQDESKASEAFTSERSGIIFGPAWMSGWPLHDVLLKNNPKAQVKAYPLPKGPSGKAAGHFSVIPNGAMLVSKDFKHMDALMLYLNKIYEMTDPPAGSPFENGLAEGYDYVMKDGKAVRDPDAIPGGKVEVFKYFLTNQFVQDPFLEANTYKKINEKAELTTPYEKNTQADLKTNPVSQAFMPAILLAAQNKDNSITNLFTAAPTKTMMSKGEALKKLESETFLKMIYGNQPISDFDKFVKQWKDLGGDKETEEVNTWYQSVTKK